MIKEIGQKREIVNREFAVGSNKEIDIDEYDLFYDQLFIWDKKEQEIIGGCRIGKGKEILSVYGKKGFYFHLMYHLKDRLIPVLKQSL